MALLPCYDKRNHRWKKRARPIGNVGPLTQWWCTRCGKYRHELVLD